MVDEREEPEWRKHSIYEVTECMKGDLIRIIISVIFGVVILIIPIILSVMRIGCGVIWIILVFEILPIANIEYGVSCYCDDLNELKNPQMIKAPIEELYEKEDIQFCPNCGLDLENIEN